MIMNKFMNNAKDLSRNPLGIIALFISLIYGFACLVLGIAGDKLQISERTPLVYFLIGFPILILVSFLFLVTKHHSKLYAPKDFRDERNFFKGFEKQQKYEQNGSAEGEQEQEDPIEIFLKWSSVKGLYAIYAVYLSKVHNVKFTLKDLELNSGLLTEEYTHGFLVAASSMGAFKFLSQDQPFEIHSINDNIAENIKDKVYQQAEKQRVDEKSDYLYDELDLLEKAFKEAADKAVGK